MRKLLITNCSLFIVFPEGSEQRTVGNEQSASADRLFLFPIMSNLIPSRFFKDKARVRSKILTGIELNSANYYSERPENILSFKRSKFHLEPDCYD